MTRYRGLALGASTFVLGIVLGFVLLDLRDSWQAPQIVITDPLPGAEIAAAIDGAIATPGAYVLPAGSRITHLVDAAGGVTSGADLAHVNLAARLRDEQQVYVPTIAATPVSGEAIANDGAVSPSFGIVSPVDARLNINTASAAELDGLPGIGPVLASRIIEDRNRAGRFSSVNELVRVSGISQRMVDELRDRITT
ncbi:hypothetical protein BH23CHL4_BH23CHL4_22590 [soil metagenome]